jgi:hypothetical protein
MSRRDRRGQGFALLLVATALLQAGCAGPNTAPSAEPVEMSHDVERNTTSTVNGPASSMDRDDQLCVFEALMDDLGIAGMAGVGAGGGASSGSPTELRSALEALQSCGLLRQAVNEVFSAALTPEFAQCLVDTLDDASLIELSMSSSPASERLGATVESACGREWDIAGLVQFGLSAHDAACVVDTIGPQVFADARSDVIEASQLTALLDSAFGSCGVEP